jgi:glutathione synthase/RimK-type ligase-like ATP-grasp enzyme
VPTPVVLATCSAFPKGAEEEGELVAACARAGLSAEWQVWDDDSVDWSAPDLVVIRSTWDYTGRRSEFLRWADGVRRLANPAGVVAWSSDKTYLIDLAARGVPVVPTAVVPAGEAIEPPVGLDFVVKPSVGAGSMGAGRFSFHDPLALDGARAHATQLHALGRTVIVQPYLEGVDTAGETAMVYFGGTFSHAIRKGAMLPEPMVHPVEEGSSRAHFVPERIEARSPSAAEHRVAERALAAIPASPPLVYARVDLLPSEDGPVVTEMELVEPSLFLPYSPGATDRLAAQMAVAAAGGSR